MSWITDKEHTNILIMNNVLYLKCMIIPMFRICKNNTNTPTKPEKSSPQNIDKNNTNKNGDKRREESGNVDKSYLQDKGIIGVNGQVILHKTCYKCGSSSDLSLSLFLVLSYLLMASSTYSFSMYSITLIIDLLNGWKLILIILPHRWTDTI